jgi:predicted phosphodiesterase
MDGKEDDLFLSIGDAYRDYRLSHPELGTWIHCGDTFDLARADSNDIKAYWSDDLDELEREDIFLLGNHEAELVRLEKIAPGKCLERIEINGYTILHGHQFFDWMDSPEEDLLINQWLWLHRKLNRKWKWLENHIEAVYQSHRDNEKVYAKLSKQGIDKAIFGHTHIEGRKGDWMTPGALFQSKTVVRFQSEDSDPVFERIERSN